MLYKGTKNAFVKAFNKDLAKQLPMPMDALELADSAKVSTICVKN